MRDAGVLRGAQGAAGILLVLLARGRLRVEDAEGGVGLNGDEAGPEDAKLPLPG